MAGGNYNIYGIILHVGLSLINLQNLHHKKVIHALYYNIASYVSSVCYSGQDFIGVCYHVIYICIQD